MSDSLTEQTAAPEVDFEAIYEAHYTLMVGVAVKRFGISETDAETLAHDRSAVLRLSFNESALHEMR